MTPNGDTAQLSLFAYMATRAYQRYRTAPPGYRVKRRREWIMETARSLI